MERKKRILLALGFILVTAAITAAQENGTKVTVQPVEEKETYNAIYYGARIEPVREHSQYPPISGVIDEINVREGQRVRKGEILFSVKKDEINKNYRPLPVEARTGGVVVEIKGLPGDPVTQGDWVVKIVETSPLKAVIQVSDQDINLVKAGDTALTSNSGGPVDGRVHRVSLLPDYNTGLFNVEARFPAGKGLFIGEFVKIELRVNYYRGIVLDKKYVLQRYGKPHVWLYQGEGSSGTVTLREVTTGPAYGDGISVTAGLAPGDLVVTNFSRMLQDGDEVILEGK